MTAAKESSVDEIVAAIELGLAEGIWPLWRADFSALISDWRRRGEELEKAQLINECHCTNIEATTSERDQAEAERDSARALLRKVPIYLQHQERATESWNDEIDDLRARIAKELGPTETKGEQHENNV